MKMIPSMSRPSLSLSWKDIKENPLVLTFFFLSINFPLFCYYSSIFLFYIFFFLVPFFAFYISLFSIALPALPSLFSFRLSLHPTPIPHPSLSTSTITSNTAPKPECSALTGLSLSSTLVPSCSSTNSADPGHARGYVSVHGQIRSLCGWVSCLLPPQVCHNRRFAEFLQLCYECNAQWE